MSLNDRQRDAATAADGPVVVVAGPGTGKTTTLAHRVAFLLREKGVPPENILAVTFTRSAAREMRERVARLLGAPAPEALWIDTFHAAALKLLRENRFPRDEFRVLSEEEKPALLDGLTAKREAPALLDRVRRMKQRLETPSNGLEGEYQRRLDAARALDFDDIFVLAVRLLEERSSLRAAYQRRFQHVLVDEFQDTSYAQYRFLKLITGGNVAVIGDPDQAIYGFAGDGFQPFRQFQKDFPDARVVALAENYRSQGTILEAAKQVIARNRPELPRALLAKLEKGLPVEIASHATDRQEAEMIARRIEGLLGGASYFTIDSGWAAKDAETYAYGLNDIAILYRFHAQARLIEKALERAGLPYRTYGKTLRANGEEVADVEDRADYLSGEAGLPPGEGIILMTLHRAKGLEFPAVFVAGCEDGVLPARDRADAEEERRLFYVGMTRAKGRLFLSHARSRFLFGETREAGPSPFLRDIAEELKRLEENRAPARPPKPKQTTLFDL